MGRDTLIQLIRSLTQIYTHFLIRTCVTYLYIWMQSCLCAHTHNTCTEAKPPTSALSSPPSHVRNADYFCRAWSQFEEGRGEEPVLLLAQSVSLWGQSLQDPHSQGAVWFKGFEGFGACWHMEQCISTLYIQPQQLLMFYLIICHRRRCYD